MQNIVYGPEAVVTICADGPDRIERCRRAIAAAGARAGMAVPIAEGAAFLDLAPAADAVLVDVAEDGGEALDGLLDRLNHAAEQGAQASVVCLTTPLIDIVAARTPHSSVVLLCEPDEEERAAKLRSALEAQTAPMLHERSAEAPAELRQLSEEVGRIARALARLSAAGGENGEAGHPVAIATPAQSSLPPLDTVRAVLRARRLRDQFFDPTLFADPAWDMLLDLLVATIERRSVAVSSLCIAACVPATTALRWVKGMTDQGLFVRTADPRDGRRVFIGLAPHAVEAMAAYFQALAVAG